MLLVLLDPEFAGGGAIGPQVIRDRQLRDKAVFLEELAHQFQCGMLIAFRLNQHVENLAFGVDGAPGDVAGLTIRSGSGSG